jgi:hypothetical protein
MTLCSTSIALSRSSSIPILTTTTTTTIPPPPKHSKEEKEQKPQTLKHPFKIPKPLSRPSYGFLTALQNPKTPFKAFLWFFNGPSKSQNPFQGLLMVF